MGERKGQNKYYPPDWDPSKGSLNAYHGTHALRERAKRINEGIIIIRFEMPYNIWCDGCKNHIGMGVRYNAEKTKVGHYYSTPIFKFRMKCHLCTSYMEIQTDPENRQYKIVSGARRVEQRWDPAENEQVYSEERDVKKRLATDAMFKQERGKEDSAKRTKAAPRLAALEEAQLRSEATYELNWMARRAFKNESKALDAMDVDGSLSAEAADILREKKPKGSGQLPVTSHSVTSGEGLRRQLVGNRERKADPFSLHSKVKGRDAKSLGIVRKSPSQTVKKSSDSKLSPNVPGHNTTDILPEATVSPVDVCGRTTQSVSAEQNVDTSSRDQESDDRSETVESTPNKSGLLGLQCYSDSSDTED